MSAFASLLAQRPALAEKYESFLAAVNAESSVPQRLYDLCRARIQQIHDVAPSGVDSDSLARLQAMELDGFTPAEAAALIVAEKIPYQHHGLLDDEIEALRQAVGNSGCVALLTAFSFYDVECRLHLTAEVLNVD